MQIQDIVQANMKETYFNEEWEWDDKKKIVRIKRIQEFEMQPIAVVEMKRRMELQKQAGKTAEQMLEKHEKAITKAEELVKKEMEKLNQKQ